MMSFPAVLHHRLRPHQSSRNISSSSASFLVGLIKNRHAVDFTITLLEGDQFVGISLILECRVK